MRCSSGRLGLGLLLTAGLAVAAETTVTTTTLTDSAGSSITVTLLPDDGSGTPRVAFTGDIMGFGHVEGIIKLEPTPDGTWKGSSATMTSGLGDGEGVGILPKPKTCQIRLNVDPDDDADGEADDEGADVRLEGGSFPGLGSRPLFN